MKEDNGEPENRDKMYDELAKNLCCARIAYRLGVTYVEKLQAGYLPLDLSEMERQEEPDDLEEPNSWIQ